jgi:hypothetical protein
LRTAAATQMPGTTPVTLGGDVTLQGAALAAPAHPGDPLLWSSRWSVTAAGAADRPVASIFVHVLTEQGTKIAAHDQAFDNHPTLWQAGDEILSWVAVPIDPAASGTDFAVGGLYQLGPGNNVTPLAGPAGPQVNLGTVRIPASATAAAPAGR